MRKTLTMIALALLLAACGAGDPDAIVPDDVRPFDPPPPPCAADDARPTCPPPKVGG